MQGLKLDDAIVDSRDLTWAHRQKSRPVVRENPNDIVELDLSNRFVAETIQRLGGVAVDRKSSRRTKRHPELGLFNVNELLRKAQSRKIFSLRRLSFMAVAFDIGSPHISGLSPSFTEITREGVTRPGSINKFRLQSLATNANEAMLAHATRENIIKSDSFRAIT